jgi:hypothetical protein
VATPITVSSIATGFPADLGTFSAGPQSITFTNPTKKIQDIKISGKATATATTLTPYTTASTYSTSSGTKVSIKVGSVQNLVPNGISVNGATALRGSAPGATAPVSLYTGVVTIKNLATASFGTLPAILSFTVMTD